MLYGEGLPTGTMDKPRQKPGTQDGWRDPSTATWDERYERLKEYKSTHGHCSVPVRQGPLGKWVHGQRSVRKKGKLSEERARKLDKLGFDWSPRGSLATWDEHLGELIQYKAKHGDCNVPARQASLGKWVHGQRTMRKRDKLSEERVRKLDEIGFEWSARDTLPTWDERLGELTQYKAKHGDCNVPVRKGPLGKWVDTQRTARKRDKLTEERVQKLDDLGFNWGFTLLTWDERLDELTKYKAKHGHCDVPARRGALGVWVNRQRKARKDDKLSVEHVRKLDEIGFNWGPRDRFPTWDERLDELIKYKAKHGDCNVPARQGSFGKWVDTQQTTRKQGKLSEERVQKLDDIGFNWRAVRGSPSTWNVRLVELMKYKTDHGNCNVPARQGSLGIWVSHQRAARKMSKLSKERVEKLDGLGFNWG